jgi:tetratricopeptide (TPR) repeat protein
LALKIAQRQFRLGKHSYSALKKRISRLRAKAAREELLNILQDCAMNMCLADLKAEYLAEIAIEFWKNKQKSFAYDIFAKALKAIEEIDSEPIRNNSLSLLAVKYAEIGEFERALSLTAYFSNITDQVRLLTDLGVAYFDKKMRERARQLFNNALELVDHESDEEQQRASKAWVAFKLAESREFFWSLEVCESLSDPDTRVAIIHQMAEKLIEFGKFATIQEIIKRVPDKYIKAELMASLVVRYSGDGYFTQAREFTDAIEVPALKARAFLAMAKEYKGKKLLQIALELIDSAVKLAYKVPKIEDKVLILTTSATLSNDFREERQACDLLRSALDEIECLDDELKRDEFLTFLVEVSLDLGQYSQATEILSRIESHAARAKATMALASKYAFLDKIDEAIALARGIEDRILRIQTLFKVVENNPDNRNYKLKSELISEIIDQAKTADRVESVDRILADCALMVAGFEKFHQSLQLLEQIHSEEIKSELIWSLAELKFKRNFFNEGIEMIRLIQNQNIRIQRLIQTGLAIFRKEYPESTFNVEDFLPIAFSFWLEEKEKLENKD